nr:MAG TPA: Restriction endonuclease [Caudoviricetes sp.]
MYYANVANETFDENEFYTAINNCLSTLEWMQQFEKYGVFVAGNTPSDDIRTLKEEMPLYEENLRKRISNQISSQKVEYDIDNMDGHTFEYYCADILRKNRFENVEVTQGSGDHGIDILAEKDGITYAIQCKCYSSNIGNAAVQQAHTGKSLYHKDIAVVLTNQHFTTQAKEEASALGVKLWDREVLTNLIAAAE